MSLANCKAICREIEEANLGENLTASVMEHLGRCGECQRFYGERLKLRQLVASLETVAAPADFDLRVRSRIANERGGTRPEFWFNNLSFRIPSIAFASLVLVVGGVFALRVWNAPTTTTVAEQTEKPKVSEPGPESAQKWSSEGVRSNVNQELVTTRKDNSDAIQRDRQPRKRSPLTRTVASSKNSGRLDSREFSITAAPVLKKEEAVASLESPVFLIETSSQPLRLSLDYSGGISRTISVPALSFGSEGVLTGGSAPLVKNSPKGAW